MSIKSFFEFSTKAETLAWLRERVTKCNIPDLCHFTIAEWNIDKSRLVDTIVQRFGQKRVIVRSSAMGEDGNLSAMAGAFLSIPHIDVMDRDSFQHAVEAVMKSYNSVLNTQDQKNQILIQHMISDVSMSGVVFTQDLNTGAPYYVINYDDETGRTDTVTAGTENSNRTLLVHRNAVDDLKSERFRALLFAVQEIEKVTGHDSLDIEFAVDQRNQVYLFQVRQITTKPNWNRGITLKINDVIERMKYFVKGHHRIIPGLYGSKSIFGEMSDWNPAEMIGTAPRPLSLSLYRYLITDYAWREARRQMGYFEPRGTRLMAALSGKPYIDVRLSFNSFLPHDLDPEICTKLVNAWLDRLSVHKELHDKIEFEVAITALTFDFDLLVEKQIPGILSDKEKRLYKEALFNLTNNLLIRKVAPIDAELEKIRLLAYRRLNLIRLCKNPDLTVVSGLLEDCVKFGTIPFSILARHAFIAASFIRSLFQRGILGEEEANLFRKSIRTIAGDLVNDVNRFLAGTIDVSKFMETYGHLRPGTYDILSRRYDQREDLLQGISRLPAQLDFQRDFSFSPSQLKRTEELLSEFGYNITPEQLISYMKDAIAAREYAKFVFTKNISDALEIIVAWGEGIGLSREELSYLNIEDILNTLNVSQGRTLEQYLRNLFQCGKEAHEVTLAVRLPYLIESPEDISIVPLFLNKPNFITQKIVRAPFVFLDKANGNIPEMTGKIVLIESADPGFDWIFSRSILGLVTKFGGANSHMAIRCAEFGLPAAIGCGEQIFDRILHFSAVELNCSEKRIEPVVV